MTVETTGTDGTRRVLVVDDEPSITDAVATALRYEGYDVTIAAGGYAALTAVDGAAPELVILDVMLPDLDGFEVTRRIRAAGNDVPVLFLTARDGIEDTVAGLGAGGDDYVTKPFALAEIVARVEAILRRAHPPNAAEDGMLRVADVELDERAHEVRRAGRPVTLTATEFKLLAYFMRNPGIVLSKSQILDNVWHYDFAGESNVVETYVRYLRRKLEADGPPLIHTVRLVGYVLRPPSGDARS
jgi:two-component system OmpR family response regulator